MLCYSKCQWLLVVSAYDLARCLTIISFNGPYKLVLLLKIKFHLRQRYMKENSKIVRLETGARYKTLLDQFRACGFHRSSRVDSHVREY